MASFQSPYGGIGRSDLSIESISAEDIPGFNHLTVAGVGQTYNARRQLSGCGYTFQSPYGGIGASDCGVIARCVYDWCFNHLTVA